MESKLTGFEFWEVWDSEAPIVEDAVNPLVFEGLAYSYREAVQLVEQGQTVTSDKWVMQLHQYQVYIGRFERNGTYKWVYPIAIPLILLICNGM